VPSHRTRQIFVRDVLYDRAGGRRCGADEVQDRRRRTFGDNAADPPGADAGDDLVRRPVPATKDVEGTEDDSKAVGRSPCSPTIQLQPHIALKGIDAGADLNPSNPGNIGGPEKVAESPEGQMGGRRR